MIDDKTSSAAAIFTAEQAPYIEYLSAINRVEARTLEHDLRAAAALVQQKNTTGSGRRAYRCTVAELRDIEVNTVGKSDNVLACTTLVDGGLTVPEPGPVSSFLSQLSDCESSVHTRIIVLHSDRTTVEGKAADGLLFCHILGTILDLPPVDVRFLAQLDVSVYHSPKQPRRPYQLPMKPGFVSLGESLIGRNRGVAAYLGRRTLGEHSPHVVVVRLQACDYEREHLPWASVGSLCEPPVYSQQRSGCGSSTLQFSAGRVFGDALKHCLRSVPPLQDNELTGSWLSALIYMDAVMRALSIDVLASRWPDTSKAVDTHSLREVSLLANQTCAELQTSVNQVVAFNRSCPLVRQLDYHDAYHFLERLLDEARTMAQEIKDIFDTQHQIKNIEVSSLAVHESKSAIAVTVLAFVFIPINLASSVYGMNVQEINETGHSIWGFAVTALVLLACSGLGWVFWRASRGDRSRALYGRVVNLRFLERHRKRELDSCDC